MATQDKKQDDGPGFRGPGEDGFRTGSSLFDASQPKRNQWERVNKGNLDEASAGETSGVSGDEQAEAGRHADKPAPRPTSPQQDDEPAGPSGGQADAPPSK